MHRDEKQVIYFTWPNCPILSIIIIREISYMHFLNCSIPVFVGLERWHVRHPRRKIRVSHHLNPKYDFWNDCRVTLVPRWCCTCTAPSTSRRSCWERRFDLRITVFHSPLSFCFAIFSVAPYLLPHFFVTCLSVTNYIILVLFPFDSFL